MMQTFRLSDVLRCILLNAPEGPNLACAGESLFGGRFIRNTKLWREAVAHRRDRVTLAWWDGIRLGGLASVRTSAGFRSWEVDRLYLTVDSDRRQANGRYDLTDTPSLELLEQMVQHAGQRSAERIFLRVPADSPVITLACRAGFSPCFEETLLEGQGSRSHRSSEKSPVSWRHLLPRDDFALFQLFTAATPGQVRAALGLTFDQWQDARALYPRRRREWVTQGNGRITGWLGLRSCFRVTTGEVMAHPDYPDLLPALIDLALARRWAQGWLVPDYQVLAGELLHDRGFHEVDRYTMLIKTVAAWVMSPGVLPVEA